MGATNCPRCGRLFHKVLANVCPPCEKIEEESFQQLCEYIKENPKAHIGQISDETGVSGKRILRYVREGRLEMSVGLQGELVCQNCGIAIKRDIYCKKCASELTTKIEVEKKKGIGMHTSRYSRS